MNNGGSLETQGKKERQCKWEIGKKLCRDKGGDEKMNLI